MRFAAKANGLILIVPLSLFVCLPASADKKPVSTDTTEVTETQNIQETLVVEWPAEGKWQLRDSHMAGSSVMEIYFPGEEDKDNWEEMATIEIVYGKTKVNLPGMARMTFLGTRKGSPDATWEILEKGYMDDTKKSAYIIYEIICPDFLTGEPPQVQLWKLIAGRTALFNVQYSYRGDKIPADKKEEMVNVLKNATLKVEEKKQGTES